MNTSVLTNITDTAKLRVRVRWRIDTWSDLDAKRPLTPRPYTSRARAITVGADFATGRARHSKTGEPHQWARSMANWCEHGSCALPDGTSLHLVRVEEFS